MVNAYIPNEADGTISVIDTATDTVVSTISIGTYPQDKFYGVTVHSASKRAYFSDFQSGRILALDTNTNGVVAAAVGNSPFAIAVNAAGTRVYVANHSSNDLMVLDASTLNVVASVAVGVNPMGVAVNASGTRVYVANTGGNDVSVIDATINSLIATIPVGAGATPEGIVVKPDGTRVYVANFGSNSNSVAVIDASTNTIVATVLVGTNPMGIAITPDGNRIYVANQSANNIIGSNDVSVIDTLTNTVIAKVQIPTTPNTTLTGTGPYGVSVTPDGKKVYVTNTFANFVTVIDVATNTIISTIAVGKQPASFGIFIGADNPPPPVLTSGFEVIKFAFLDFDKNWERKLLPEAVMEYIAIKDAGNLAVVFEGETGTMVTYHFRVAPKGIVYVIGHVVHIPARCLKQDKGNSIRCG